MPLPNIGRGYCVMLIINCILKHKFSKTTNKIIFL